MEVSLVSSFMPGIKHPLLMLNGHQGSAKTTAARILKTLVDPSAVDVGPLPKTVAEIAQLLSHQYFTIFDNLSEIKPAVSDLLCQAAVAQAQGDRIDTAELQDSCPLGARCENKPYNDQFD